MANNQWPASHPGEFQMTIQNRLQVGVKVKTVNTDVNQYFYLYVKRKILFNAKVHRAALISRFLSPQPDTSLHCETTDMGLVHRMRCVCLCLSLHQYSLCSSTKGWLGWVGLDHWLHTEIVTHLSTNRAWRWLTSMMRSMMLPTKPDRHLIISYISITVLIYVQFTVHCDYRTPLHMAILNNNPEAFSVLLTAGGLNLELKDNDGFTVLWLALSSETFDLEDGESYARRLVAYGSSPNTVISDSGKLTLDLALDLSSTRILVDALDHTLTSFCSVCRQFSGFFPASVHPVFPWLSQLLIGPPGSDSFRSRLQSYVFNFFIYLA